MLITTDMNRNEQWDAKYKEAWQFVETNRRGPSRHHIEEHQLLNWMKFNRKSVNKGTMPAERKEKFQKLTDFIHSFHKINQYI